MSKPSRSTTVTLDRLHKIKSYDSGGWDGGGVGGGVYLGKWNEQYVWLHFRNLLNDQCCDLDETTYPADPNDKHYDIFQFTISKNKFMTYYYMKCHNDKCSQC